MKKGLAKLLVGGLLWLTLAGPAEAKVLFNGGEWSRLNQGEIVVTLGPPAPTRLFQVMGLVNASPERVYKVLTDFENHTQIYSLVSKSSVKERPAATKLITYKELSLPWPLVSRWFTTRVELHPDRHGYDWWNIDGNAGKPHGNYQTMRRGDKTLLIYQIWWDTTETWLPKFLFNAAQQVAMPGIVKDVRKAVARY